MEDIRKGTCPLCRHNEVVETRQVEMGDQSVLYPFHAHVRDYETGIVTRRRRATGAWTAYVCRRCGYGQWFARDPQEIPIGEKHDTRLIKGPEPAGPYR